LTVFCASLRPSIVYFFTFFSRVIYFFALEIVRLSSRTSFHERKTANLQPSHGVGLSIGAGGAGVHTVHTGEVAGAPCSCVGGRASAGRKSAAPHVRLFPAHSLSTRQVLWAFVHISIPLSLRTCIAVVIMVNTLTVIVGALSAWLRCGHRTLLCTLLRRLRTLLRGMACMIIPTPAVRAAWRKARVIEGNTLRLLPVWNPSHFSLIGRPNPTSLFRFRRHRTASPLCCAPRRFLICDLPA
jgi:hypothetical protein